MTNFFRNFGRKKLYKQWMEKEGLSPEDLPADLKKDTGEAAETDADHDYEASPRRAFRPRTEQPVDSLFSAVSVRTILVMALIIVVLLVALAVVSTVLVMRGC